MSILGKSFFGFVYRFFALILVGLFFVFAVGFYEVEFLGKGKEVAAPVQNNKTVVGDARDKF